MATVSPSVTTRRDKVLSITWTGLATGDTIVPYLMDEVFAAPGCVQITGTFGGATVTLNHSNDGTNFIPITDPADANISVTDAGVVSFISGALWIAPGISGGTSDDVDVTVVLRS